ncbi:MAG TPA: hypothetical protein VJ721_03125 [Chthoniobacterales bacterium]|nr:hypothetical protein [Chthoniobacterales bacterium]
MSSVRGEKSAEPVGMTHNQLDRVQSLQLILNAAERQPAVTHEFANVSRPFFAPEK